MPQKALARRLGMTGALAILPEEAAFGAAGGTQAQQHQSENRERASNHRLILPHRRPAREILSAPCLQLTRMHRLISVGHAAFY